jgi:2,3,4,5-tetrahydropyridine-2-carboxylate N-succinyltransferase
VSEIDAIAARIEASWESTAADPAAPIDAEAVEAAIGMLDRGEVRVAEPDGDGWRVQRWAKQAVLLYFRIRGLEVSSSGPFEYHDKLPLKHGFEALGVRVVPPATVRYGAYLSRGVVLMPSYVNIGARVGAGTMVDTWATVGSCAQVGANVHLSGGVGIGGVLEPPQAAPVMIGDDCFIGSRCMVVDGARVGEGSVLGAGLILSRSIPVIDAETGEELGRGDVPPWSVAVTATRPRSYPGGEFGLPCALVIRRLAEGDRHDKGKLETLLRQHGATGA